MLRKAVFYHVKCYDVTLCTSGDTYLRQLFFFFTLYYWPLQRHQLDRGEGTLFLRKCKLYRATLGDVDGSKIVPCGDRTGKDNYNISLPFVYNFIS